MKEQTEIKFLLFIHAVSIGITEVTWKAFNEKLSSTTRTLMRIGVQLIDDHERICFSTPGKQAFCAYITENVKGDY